MQPQRRSYSKSFKAQVIQERAQPGASIASIALSHSLNANLVHKWIRVQTQKNTAPQPAFIPLPMQLAGVNSQAASSNICVEIQHPRGTVKVNWPTESAAAMIRIDSIWLAHRADGHARWQVAADLATYAGPDARVYANKPVRNMINIREATKADLDVLREIGCETYQEHFSDIWSLSGMQDFLNQDFSPNLLGKSLESSACHLWLIASNESDRVVGFAKVNWSTPAPLTGELGAELQKIYFLKSEAGRGYGKQLLHFICSRARERGERLLWLDVLKTNSNARRFYEGFGFQEIGEIPFKTDLVEIGMVAMACELSR